MGSGISIFKKKMLEDNPSFLKHFSLTDNLLRSLCYSPAGTQVKSIDKFEISPYSMNSNIGVSTYLWPISIHMNLEMYCYAQFGSFYIHHKVQEINMRHFLYQIQDEYETQTLLPYILFEPITGFRALEQGIASFSQNYLQAQIFQKAMDSYSLKHNIPPISKITEVSLEAIHQQIHELSAYRFYLQSRVTDNPLQYFSEKSLEDICKGLSYHILLNNITSSSQQESISQDFNNFYYRCQLLIKKNSAVEEIEKYIEEEFDTIAGLRMLKLSLSMAPSSSHSFIKKI